MSEPIGRFVGVIRPVSSTKFWGGQGYGRRWLFLFGRGMVVAETNVRGTPLGADEWLTAMGAAADSSPDELASRVQELVGLDRRNVLVSIDQVSVARLTSRRWRGVWRLQLVLVGGREMSFFWARPFRTYARVAADGTLEAPPSRPAATLLGDLRQILGPRLADGPDRI